MKKYIAIAGNMGAGKSTMVDFLHRTYNFTPVYEPFLDNPYLDDFYKDMKKWSFHSQLYFLTEKFKLHVGLNDSREIVIQDRSIYEDAEIFCTNLYRSRKIRKRDYNTYMALYETMKSVLQPPDLMIYLRCSVRTIRKRIRQRGRESELNIPISYIRNLNRQYEEWISQYSLSPVVIWDSGKLNYLTDLVHREDFHQMVEQFVLEEP